MARVDLTGKEPKVISNDNGSADGAKKELEKDDKKKK